MSKKKIDFETIAEGVSDYIEDLFHNIPEEYKADIASLMAFEAANWGCDTTFEGIGALEMAKFNYITSCIQVTEEESQKLSN